MKRCICRKHKVEKKNGVCTINPRCAQFILVDEDQFKMFTSVNNEKFKNPEIRGIHNGKL